jgi:hypothetical protein
MTPLLTSTLEEHPSPFSLRKTISD